MEAQPRVLGWDAAGVVEAVGPDVTLFKAGDPVYYAGDINRAHLMPIGDERHKLLGEIQQRAVDQAFIVPMYHLAAKSSVHGIGFKPQLDGPASAYEISMARERDASNNCDAAADRPARAVARGIRSVRCDSRAAGADRGCAGARSVVSRPARSDR